jgi:hypothetical protein
LPTAGLWKWLKLRWQLATNAITEPTEITLNYGEPPADKISFEEEEKKLFWTECRWRAWLPLRGAPERFRVFPIGAIGYPCFQYNYATLLFLGYVSETAKSNFKHVSLAAVLTMRGSLRSNKELNEQAYLRHAALPASD